MSHRYTFSCYQCTHNPTIATLCYQSTHFRATNCMFCLWSYIDHRFQSILHHVVLEGK
uniref:Uncharacterized protein n=1 Tax=Rhizophora mucronata TaxID=61149 RepID=A0A2P2KEE4_RHIMU